MASDAFVYWKDKRPTRLQVEQVIQDFFGEVLTHLEWDKDRFFGTLVGTWSHPFGRATPSKMIENMRPEAGFEARDFEVWMDHTCLDVITRQQDWFTGVCARALADILAKRWDGRRED